MTLIAGQPDRPFGKTDRVAEGEAPAGAAIGAVGFSFQGCHAAKSFDGSWYYDQNKRA
jgi:hypothetical protein